MATNSDKKVYDGWSGSKDGKALSSVFAPYMQRGEINKIVEMTRVQKDGNTAKTKRGKEKVDYSNIPEEQINEVIEFMNELKKAGYMFYVTVDSRGNFDADIIGTSKLTVRLLCADKNSRTSKELSPLAKKQLRDAKDDVEKRKVILSEEDAFIEKPSNRMLGRVYYNNSSYEVNNTSGKINIKNKSGKSHKPQFVYNNNITMQDRLNVLRVALGEAKSQTRRYKDNHGNFVTMFKLEDADTEVKRQDNVNYSTMTIAKTRSSTDSPYEKYIKQTIDSAQNNFVEKFSYNDLCAMGRKIEYEHGNATLRKKVSFLNNYEDDLADSNYIKKIQKNFIYDAFLNSEGIYRALSKYCEEHNKSFESATYGDLLNSGALTCLSVEPDSHVYDYIRNELVSFSPKEDFTMALYNMILSTEIGSFDNGFNPTKVISMANSTKQASAQKSMQFAIMRADYDRNMLIGDKEDYNYVSFVRSTKSFNENTNISLNEIKNIVADAKKALETEEDPEQKSMLELSIKQNEFKMRAMESVKEALINSGAVTEHKDLKYINPTGSYKREEVPVNFYDDKEDLIDIEMDNNGIIKWTAFRLLGSRDSLSANKDGFSDPITAETLKDRQYPKNINGEILRNNAEDDLSINPDDYKYYANYEQVSGYIGQVFVPDEYDLIHTNFDIGDNSYLCPCNTGQILPDDLKGEHKTMGERLRVSTFEDNLKKQIKTEITRQFTMNIIPDSKRKNTPDENIKNNTRALATEFATTTLNLLYTGDTFAIKVADDFMTTPNISEDTKQARVKQYKSTINLPKSYIAIAKTDAIKAYREALENSKDLSGFQPLLELTGGKSIRVLWSDEYLGYVSLLATGNNFNTQGITLVLTDGAEVAEDGHIIPAKPLTDPNTGKPLLDNEGKPIDPGSPLEQIIEFEKRRNNTADRCQNALSQIGKAKAEYKDTVIASVPFFGWTQDDAYVISQEMADKYQIHREDGTESSLKVGDKISDAGANKGIISLIVDRNWTAEEAREKGLYEEWRVFKDNPTLEAIAPTYSMANRNNLSVVLGFIENYDGETLTYRDPYNPSNEMKLPCMSKETLYALEQTVDKKTTTYDDSDKKRKMSAQLLWALSSKNLNALGAALYGNNKKEWSKFREYLIALGKDIDKDGTLLDKYTPREDIRDILPNKDQLLEPVKEKRNRFVIDPTSIGNNATSEALNNEIKSIQDQLEDGMQDLSDETVEELSKRLDELREQEALERAPINKFYSEIGESGGQLLIPKDFGGDNFDLTYLLDSKQKLEVTKEIVSDGTTREFYVVPVLSKSLRLDYQDETDERSYNDYTYMYNNMIDAVISYYKNKNKLESKSLSTETKTEAANRMDGFVDDFTTNFADLQGKLLRMVLNGSGSGKNAFIRNHLMSSNIEHSATSVLMPNPKLPIDTVEADMDVLRSLGLTRFVNGEEVPIEDRKILMWRDPTLTTGALRAVNVKCNDNVHGISINPILAKSMDADFDGDTLGMAAIDSADVKGNIELLDKINEELEGKLTPKRNLLDMTENPDPETGRFPLYFNLKMDVKMGEIQNIPFTPSEETLNLLHNIGYDKYALNHGMKMNQCLLKDIKNISEYRANLAYKLRKDYSEYGQDSYIHDAGSDGKKLRTQLIKFRAKQELENIGVSADDIQKVSSVKSASELDSEYLKEIFGRYRDSLNRINKEVKPSLNNKDFYYVYAELHQAEIPGYPDEEAIRQFANKEADRYENESFVTLQDYALNAFKMANPAAFHNDFSSAENYLKRVYDLWQTGVKLPAQNSFKFEEHMRYMGTDMHQIISPYGGADGNGCRWEKLYDTNYSNLGKSARMERAIQIAKPLTMFAIKEGGVANGQKLPDTVYIKGMFFDKKLGQDREYSLRLLTEDAGKYKTLCEKYQPDVTPTKGPYAYFDTITEEQRSLCSDGKAYVDYDISPQTYATQQDKENTQLSVAARVDTTAAGGTMSQFLISTFRDFNPSAMLDVAYHTYQGILQLKHSASEADKVINSVDDLMGDISKGRNPYNKFKGYSLPFRSGKEFAEALMRWNKETFGVEINKEAAVLMGMELERRAPEVVNPKTGNVYKDFSFDTYKNNYSSLLDRLSYQVNNSIAPDAILNNACKNGENIFESMQGDERKPSSVATVINGQLTVDALASSQADEIRKTKKEEYVEKTSIHEVLSPEQKLAYALFGNNEEAKTIAEIDRTVEAEVLRADKEPVHEHKTVELNGFDELKKFAVDNNLIDKEELDEPAQFEDNNIEDELEAETEDTSVISTGEQEPTKNIYESPDSLDSVQDGSVDDQPSK